jgi:hypothetical protein
MGDGVVIAPLGFDPRFWGCLGVAVACLLFARTSLVGVPTPVRVWVSNC